ncbi:MAG: hypothetical protein FJ284_03740 [Planctomycetes bacterium]|nr:hypothetical protein [Planctomycetota bacterium]
MSVIRPRPPEEPLGLDAADAIAEASARAAELAGIRAAILDRPDGVDLASRTLDEYDTRRTASRLFAILSAARRIRDSVDRLVLVAGGAVGPATRLLVAACCHPFHDHLTRGERGGRPRLAWLDGASGNDEVQGLLDCLAAGGVTGDDLLDRWCLMPVDAPPDDPRQEAIVTTLAGRLARAVASDAEGRVARFVPLAAADSRLATRARELGAAAAFTDVVGIAGPQAAFSAAVLLPAAAAGIDVVRLLKGAAAMLRRFAEAPVEDTPPLVDAVVAARASAAGRHGRVFRGGGRWWSELAAWHAHLRPAGAGAGAVVTRIAPGESRRDGLGLAEGAEVETAADVVCRLPRVDEHAIGQLLQCLILSRVVETRLRPTV